MGMKRDIKPVNLLKSPWSLRLVGQHICPAWPLNSVEILVYADELTAYCSHYLSKTTRVVLNSMNYLFYFRSY
jgi:hypothetical protein